MTAEKVVAGIAGVLGETFRGDRAGRSNFSAPNFDGVLKREVAVHQEMEGTPVNYAFGEAIGNHAPRVEPS